MKKQIINPPQLFDSVQFGFSQIVVVPTGRATILMSGQVAWNAERQIVGPGDMRAQVVQTLKNIELALAQAGATLRDVVSLRIYIKYSHIGEWAAISDGLKQFFGDEPPCATWIGVPGLVNEDFLIEIEPVAVLP
jgi:2-iminobutanoate/2-iminopropanoate deaminase